MRRASIALAALLLLVGIAAVGCGGGEDQTATPETVTGTVPTGTEPTDTEPTETQPTDTEPTDTEPTDTEPTDTEPTETEPTETEPTETEPEGPDGDAEAGRAVFLGSSNCGACHTLTDAGTSGTVGPNLDQSQPTYELALDRIANGQGGMPAFSGSLSEQEIADVAAYVAEESGS